MRRRLVAWVSLVAGALCATGSEPALRVEAQQVACGAVVADPAIAGEHASAAVIPVAVFASLPGDVRRILERPTLSARGPSELFRGRAGIYDWLLDHPDQAVLIWRRLGAKCMDIDDQGSGWFGWSDRQGSAVHWQTVHRSSQLRIWYAEGTGKPSVLLPAVPARAVVVLHMTKGSDHAGRPVIRHQAEIYLQTDSKSTLLVARLLGTSVPRLADQAIGQMEIFFSALTWYLDRHPERAEGLLPVEFSSRAVDR